MFIWEYIKLCMSLIAASFPNAFQSQTAQQLQAAANSPAGKQTEGKANLKYMFVCCLPTQNFQAR